MSTRPLTPRQIRDQAVINELRGSGGRDEDGGATRVIITVASTKTGGPLTVPVCVREDGADLVIAASAGGQPSHPGWYKDIQAKDVVTVEYLGQTYPARAELVSNTTDRDRLFGMMSEVITGLYSYQDRCRETRQIPVIRLRRQ